jgi:hypothetical protein
MPNLIKIHPSVRSTLLEETEWRDDTVRCKLPHKTKKLEYKKRRKYKSEYGYDFTFCKQLLYGHKTYEAHHRTRDGKKGQNKQPYINQAK